MKKFVVAIFLMITGVTWSQHGEKIRVYKTAYITEQLDLSPAEAEKFWPIYNTFDNQLSEIRRKERREIFHAVKGELDTLSEEEAKALVTRMRELKKQEHHYHEALLDDLLAILPAKKILKLKQAEEGFKRTLLKRFKNRRGERTP